MDTLSGKALRDRFDALTSWLRDTEGLWRPRPFYSPVLPWEAEHPELSAWTRSLSQDRIRQLEDHLDDDGPPLWRESLQCSRSLTELPNVSIDAEPVLTHGVRARKQRQVAALHAVLAPELTPEDTVVEWCAGRGHLGRGLSMGAGCDAILLEHNAALCGPPKGMPEHPGVRHVEVDVLSDEVHAHIPAGAHLIGLHACGSLTDRLLDVAESRELSRYSVAPCCHWKLHGAERYTPRSRPGTHGDLRLGHGPLHLAVVGMEVTSPSRREARFRTMAMRLAVDRLARERTGDDRHHGFPSLQRRWFRGSLRELREHIATASLPVGGDADDDALMAYGTARTWEIRALGLARSLFRRPLELWVDLDRALWMHEQGRAVDVGTFCPPDVSPRNILIRAR